MAITTSITINIVDPQGNEVADGWINVELDAREDGFNRGKSQFYSGDSPVFFLYKSPNVSSIAIQTTSGSVTGPLSVSTMNPGVLQKTDEIVTFSGADSASLQFLPNGTPTLEVIAGSAPGLLASGRNLTTSDKAVAIVKANYETNYEAYQLTGIPSSLGGLTSFPIVIVITGVVGA